MYNPTSAAHALPSRGIDVAHRPDSGDPLAMRDCSSSNNNSHVVNGIGIEDQFQTRYVCTDLFGTRLYSDEIHEQVWAVRKRYLAHIIVENLLQ